MEAQIGEVNTIYNHDQDLRFLKKPWTGVNLCSFEQIRSIANGNKPSGGFTWPDEGAFKKSRWYFNENHEGFEPLVIDRITATALVTIYDALENQANKDKLARWVGLSRGHFAKMYEFAMEKVTVKFVTA
jgi:hypothetical protein